MCVLSYQRVSVRILWCLRTHQVIQHPHQRLKLQLTDLPIVLSSHVDCSRCGHVEHSWFVLLWVQHYEVVHAAGTWYSIHLKNEKKKKKKSRIRRGINRAGSMWGSTVWWLMQHKKETERPFCHQTSTALDHPPKMRIGIFSFLGLTTFNVWERRNLPKKLNEIPLNLKLSQHHGIYSTWQQTWLGGFIYRN